MAEKNIFKRAYNYLRSKEKPEERGIYTGPTTSLGLPYGTVSSPIAINTATQISTVYRCVEVISDAIASENWDVLEYTEGEGWKDNPFSKISYMLNVEPSKMYSRYMLMKSLVARVLLYGNGYLIIHRNGIGDPIMLELVSVEVQRFLNADGSSYYEIGPAGNSKIYEDEDIIHIINKSYNGLIGVSVIADAVNTLNLAIYSEASAKGFFSAGANMAGILSVENKLTKEKALEIKNSWSAAFDVTTGTPGGIAVMEGGLEFTPVNINPKDAQMLETRKFNVIEICRFFGVAPSKVFDDANLTYSNVESFQLGFISDTVAPLNAKIEGEFNRKLLRPSKRLLTRLNLNIKSLLSYNLDAKANYVSKMFQSGGYTVNEVRSEVGNPKIKDGDEAYVQVNMKKVREPEPLIPVEKSIINKEENE